jgi:hypothetical protein
VGLQVTTKNLSPHKQAEFPLGSPKRQTRPLDLNILYSKTTFAGALQYVYECGNFEVDKQCYDPLGIDSGNFSKMLSGKASFPQDKEEQFQDLCGNQGLVLWRAFRAGKGVYDLQGALEKENATLKLRVAELERDIEAYRRLHAK